LTRRIDAPSKLPELLSIRSPRVGALVFYSGTRVETNGITLTPLLQSAIPADFGLPQPLLLPLYHALISCKTLI